MNLSPCLTMEHQAKNLFCYQDNDLQPEKNQIFLSITVIFLYKTEGGGKKTTTPVSYTHLTLPTTSRV